MSTTDAARSAADPSVRDPVPVAAMLQGFDTFTGSARSTALKGSTGPGKIASAVDYTVCNTTDSFYQAVGLSASLAASSLFYSVDVKTEFAHKIGMDATSVSIVVHATTQTENEYVTVELNVEPPTDLAAFFRAYGDSWVSELTTGAEYFAVYTFYAKSTEQQLEVQAGLDAAGLVGGSLDAKLQAKLDQVQMSSSVQTEVHEFMAGISGVPFPEPGDIVEFALKFPTLPVEQPAVLTFDTSGYETVPGIPPSFSKIVQNRRKFSGSAATPGLSGKIVQLGTVREQCRSIETVYQDFGYTGDTDLAAKCEMNRNDLQAAEDWLNAVEADPTGTLPEPPLPSLANGFPSLTVVTKTGPTWGHVGPGDAAFNDVPAGSAAFGQAVRGLFIQAGDFIDRLFVSYENADGDTWDAFHGGSGGTPSPLLQLAPDEVITSVSVFPGTDAFLTLLGFTTSLGQTLSWPTYRVDPPIVWNVPAGETLVGFKGAAGILLAQLAPVTMSFVPAMWKPFPPDER